MANDLLRQLAGFSVQHGYALLPCMQIAPYNFHLGLLRPEPFLVGYRKSLLGSSRGRRTYVISQISAATVSRSIAESALLRAGGTEFHQSNQCCYCFPVNCRISSASRWRYGVPSVKSVLLLFPGQLPNQLCFALAVRSSI